jgi:hypothetical protein
MAHSLTRPGRERSFLNFIIMKDLLCKQLMYFGGFDYMKVSTYNEFEYCKVFGYYLNVYM